VKRIGIHKPRVAREHPSHEILPADPRDPDVVRVKALARARTSRLPSDRRRGPCTCTRT